jgi:hypothetical protein
MLFTSVSIYHLDPLDYQRALAWLSEHWWQKDDAAAVLNQLRLLSLVSS